MSPREIDLELQRALEEDNVKVVRDLLSRKADPTAPSPRGQTPLEIAVEKDSVAACRLLLVYQADPESLQSPGSGSSEALELVRCWGQGDVPTVFTALEECVIDAASAHDVSLLGLALASIDIAGGDAEQIAALLDERHNTLLHLCALGTGQSSGPGAEAAARLTARALLGWGVPAQGRNQKDETALLFAMRAMHSKLRGRVAGKPPMVPAEPARALLEARAEVETVDPQTQETLLMQAAKEGDVTACRLLLEYRADPLRQNLQGQNAINLCNNRPEVAMLLKSSLVSLRNREEAELELEQAPLPETPSSKDSMNGVNGTKQIMTVSIGEEVSGRRGLVNEVDLEMSYEADWKDADAVARAALEIEDPDWDLLESNEVAESCG